MVCTKRTFSLESAIALCPEVAADLAGGVDCAIAVADILGCGVEIASSRGNNAAIALL